MTCTDGFLATEQSAKLTSPIMKGDDCYEGYL